MRPNVDVPWSLHGRIKERVAEGEYDDLDEAYAETLRRGLD
jgi:Arc/MetJ-type ribon-helix-helix transcriptional regulator